VAIGLIPLQGGRVWRGRAVAGDQPGQPLRLAGLQAVIGHVTSFWTWHSLCVNEGLSDQEAVQAMAGMGLAAMPAPQAGPAPSGAAAARAGRTSR
jgi:hypothetical protein